MSKSVKHFVFPSDHGPMGLSLTPDDIEIVNRMKGENPGKYPEGAEGVLDALSYFRMVNKSVAAKIQTFKCGTPRLKAERRKKV